MIRCAQSQQSAASGLKNVSDCCIYRRERMIGVPIMMAACTNPNARVETVAGFSF
jgi:hypothetical protein